MLCSCKCCNPGRRLQESPRPGEPGIPKESPKSFFYWGAPGSKKCLKQSRNSLETVSKQSRNSLKIDCFETPETISRLFRDCFGHFLDPGARALWARKTPVRGNRGCNANAQFHGVFHSADVALRRLPREILMVAFSRCFPRSFGSFSQFLTNFSQLQ